MLDLPRSDSTATQELVIVEPLKFTPGTGLLTAEADSTLRREVALAAADPGSSVRILVPPGPASVTANRMNILNAAISRPLRSASWGVTPSAPNLEPDNGVLIIHRVGLPQNMCQTDPALPEELGERAARHGCEVLSALDMNVADPRDEIAGEETPPETAEASQTQRKARAPRSTIKPPQNRPSRGRGGYQ